jgi:hypothetical protein
VAEPLADLGQREADFSDPPEHAFTFSRFHACNTFSAKCAVLPINGG